MLFVFLSDLQIAVRFLLLSFWKHFSCFCLQKHSEVKSLQSPIWQLSSEQIFRTSPATTEITVMSCASDFGKEKSSISHSPRGTPPADKHQRDAKGLRIRQTLQFCCAQPAPRPGSVCDFPVPKGEIATLACFRRVPSSCRSQDHRGHHISPRELLQPCPELHADRLCGFTLQGLSDREGRQNTGRESTLLNYMNTH